MPSLGPHVAHAVLWVGTGVWLAALFLSLPFTLFVLALELVELGGDQAEAGLATASFDLGLFEYPALVFEFSIKVGAFEVLPLAAASVILDRRRRAGWVCLDSVPARSALLALLAAIGVLLAPIVTEPRFEAALLGVASVGAAVAWTGASLGLVAAHALIPAIRRGARPVAARIWRDLRGAALVVALLCGMAGATAAVETSLVLACDDDGSCYRSVECRGFPYPFLRPGLEPFTFLYDAATLGLPVLVVAGILRRRRQCWEPSPGT